MSSQGQEPTHLFATYLEMVNESGPNRRRRQWVIFPQMPARLAPGDSPITSYKVWFEREQRTQSHRAVWQYHRDTSGMFARNLSAIVESYSNVGWVASPVITCEIHPTELAAILKDPKTPYRILQRLQKVAKGLHRLDIS